VGLYHVTEAAEVSLDEPFFAHAFPDAAEENGVRHGRLTLIAGRQVESLPLNVPAQPMWVATVDPYGNPLSNLEVEFEVLPPEREEPLPDLYQNATILDSSDAEVSSATFVTSYLGRTVLTRLGNVDDTRYRIAARREDSLHPAEPLEFWRDAVDLRSTKIKRPIGETLFVVYRQNGVALGEGGHLWMGKAGQKLQEKVAFTLYALQEDYKVVQNDAEDYELEGLGTFIRRDIDDGSVTPVLLKGEGRFEPASREGSPGGFYEFDLHLGKEPGERSVSHKVEATLTYPWVNPDDPDDIREIETKVSRSPGVGNPIWGVDVSIIAQAPNPFVLDGNGISRRAR
jgi:hypothetical protein